MATDPSNGPPPLATEHLNGGVAKVFQAGSTARRFSVQLFEQQFDLTWDPREHGMVMAAQPSSWQDRSGNPLDDAKQQRILDALWLLSNNHHGPNAIFEYIETFECCILHRGKEPMIRVTSNTVEVLFKGKTAHLKYTNEGLSESGTSIARLEPDRARWRYPTEVPLKPSEWKVVAEACLTAERSPLFLSSFPWQFTLGGNNAG